MAFDPRPKDKRHFKSQRFDLDKSYAPSVDKPDTQKNDGDVKIQQQESLIEDTISRILNKGDVAQAEALKEQLNLIRKETYNYGKIK